MSAPGRRPCVGAVVQARTGSHRLPGKVMATVAGMPMLRLVLLRTGRARTLDRVVCATTTRPEDDRVEEVVRGLGLPTYRGSEDDVLGRYVEAAAANGIDVVVRITADCPFVDPTVVDLVVSHFLAQPGGVDYASNTWPRSVPTGLDVEVVSAAALARAASLASAPRDREHVTLYVKEHPREFRLSPVAVTDRALDARWTVDETADLEFARAVYAALGDRDDVGWGEVLSLLERRPDLARLNANVRQHVP